MATSAAVKKAAKRKVAAKKPAPKHKVKLPKNAAQKTAAAAAVGAVKKPPVKKPAVKPASKPATAPTPTAPVEVPVAGSGGSLVTPETWEQDQARLVFNREDQAEAFDLNQQSNEAVLDYQSTMNDLQRARDTTKLGITQQRDQMNTQRPQDFADLNSSLSYRGVGRRGSAAARKIGSLTSSYTQAGNALDAADTKATTDFDTDSATAFNRQNTTLTGIAQRRLQLAGNASAGGSYTTGTTPATDTGVEAPKATSNPPKPAAKPAVKPAAKPATKFKGKYPGPDIFKGNAKMRAEYAKQIKGKKLSEAAKRKLALKIAGGK